LHLYAVESEDSIAEPASHDRWLGLATHVVEEPERMFHLVIPSGSRDYARLWWMQMSVDADLIRVAVQR
jgi:hypothetical protein